jgi:hypothetical protein
MTEPKFCYAVEAAKQLILSVVHRRHAALPISQPPPVRDD